MSLTPEENVPPMSLASHHPAALLLDLDGVIRHWLDEPVSRVEDEYSLPRGSIFATATGLPEYELGVLGQVSFGDWCKATADALARDHGPKANAAIEEWQLYRGHVDHAVVAAIRAIRHRLPVALISNAHDCLRDDLRELGLTDLFDVIICSAEENMAKPDPELYRRSCDRLGIRPEQGIFFDDRLENVLGARQAGLSAEVFSDVSQLLDL